MNRKIITPKTALALLVSSSLSFGQTPVDVELSLVTDISGSVDESEFNLIIQGYASAFRNTSVHNAIASGRNGAVSVNLIFFDSSASVGISSTLLNSANSSNNFADLLVATSRPRAGGTDIATGVELANASFSTNTFNGERQVINVTADGDGGLPTNLTSSILMGETDTINAVAVGDSTGNLLVTFQNSLVGGDNGFASEALTFEDFEQAIARSLISNITGILVLDENLVHSLLSGYQFQSLARQLPNLTLNGTHHNLLLEKAAGVNGWHSWSTGDFARHSKLDSNQIVGEVGVSHDLGNKNFRIGLGLGHSSIDQNAVFGGGANIKSNFAVLEANYLIPNSSLILSSLVYFADSRAETVRGYFNSGVLDSSSGATDVRSRAVRFRIDWKDIYKKDKIAVSSKLSYTLLDTLANSFTESGGGFPVRYDPQNNFESEIRWGIDFDYKHSTKTKYRTMLELVKRFENETQISGNILGAGGFNFSANNLKSVWGRLGFEAIREISKNQTLRASLFGSTAGADASVSGSINYDISF